MNPISITVTGRLGDDPRTFTTRDGTDGTELRLALDLPARSSGDGITRWVKITAYGLLATRTAESVRKGDRVTVLADDFVAEAWAATGSGEPRARITLRAREIAASMAVDSLRTNYAARKAARAAANGQDSDLPAGEHAYAGDRLDNDIAPAARAGIVHRVGPARAVGVRALAGGALRGGPAA